MWSSLCISVSKYLKIWKGNTDLSVCSWERERGRTWRELNWQSFWAWSTIFSQLLQYMSKKHAAFLPFGNFPQRWKNWWEQCWRWGWQHITKEKTSSNKHSIFRLLLPNTECLLQGLHKNSSYLYMHQSLLVLKLLGVCWQICCALCAVILHTLSTLWHTEDVQYMFVWWHS